MTDAQGRFVLPEVKRRSISQLLAAEFVVAQQLVVIYQDKEYEIWSNSKRDASLNAELGGLPLNLTCELSAEEKMYRDFGAALFTKCIWHK